MKIVQAKARNIEDVKLIVSKTISEIYPHYYPQGVVDFFLAHHSDDNIMRDIGEGRVYLIKKGGDMIGTVTVKGNEICRLFVLPDHQHKGVGQQLLDFAEEMIAKEYTEICLDSSLPAKSIYAKRGYMVVESHTIVAENGDVLCYDLMKKQCINE